MIYSHHWSAKLRLIKNKSAAREHVFSFYGMQLTKSKTYGPQGGKFGPRKELKKEDLDRLKIKRKKTSSQIYGKFKPIQDILRFKVKSKNE